MVIIGIDAHKRSHTAVFADTVGRQIAVKTIGTTSNDHLALLAWARNHDDQERLWAIEDCRHLSRRLESDLLAAGEQLVRVPPKLMSLARIKFHLDDFSGIVADLAQRLLTHLHRLTEEIDELTAELSRRIPSHRAGTAGHCRLWVLDGSEDPRRDRRRVWFRSKDAYARHNGTAPLPVWSSNKARHRLSRTGNRQLNAALHRIALTQARCHPGARELLARP